MEVIGAAFGRHLNLRAAEAPILGIVTVSYDLYALNGLFRRRDNCRSAPHRAGRANTVNGNPVVLILLALGQNLRTVFCGEYAGVAAGCTWALWAGKLLSA